MAVKKLNSLLRLITKITKPSIVETPSLEKDSEYIIDIQLGGLSIDKADMRKLLKLNGLVDIYAHEDMIRLYFKGSRR